MKYYINICLFLIILSFFRCQHKNDGYRQMDIYRLFDEKKDDSLKIVLNDFILKDSVEAIYFKGFITTFCSEIKHDDDTIIYYMEKAKKKYPNDLQINYILGSSYYEKYQEEKSLECFKTALENFNKKEEFTHFFIVKIDYIKLCRVYVYNLVDLKKLNEAEMFLNSIDIDGKYKKLLSVRGYLKKVKGDKFGSLKDYALYNKYFPQNSKIQRDEFGTYSKRSLKNICF